MDCRAFRRLHAPEKEDAYLDSLEVIAEERRRDHIRVLPADVQVRIEERLARIEARRQAFEARIADRVERIRIRQAEEAEPVTP